MSKASSATLHGITLATLRATAACIAVIALALPALAVQPEDAWITTKVKMSLLTDGEVDALQIDVDTFDGRVTLHGQAGSEAARAQAAKLAGEVEGVREVRNLVAVVPEEARETTEVSDEKLEESISTVLERDAALEGSDVEVESVNDGVVVLAGEAKTLSAHRRALEDARSVDGVRRVASQIHSPDELGDEEIWQDADSAETITERAEQAASDAWITARAKVFLMTDPGISPLSVNVDTARGVVTLFGSVATEELKERAGEEVRKISGVKAVENEIQVVPDVAAERVEAQDEEIQAAVVKRIGEREALGDADIDVQVENRVARLTGTVASQSDRLTALTVARATSGVHQVIDDLKLERPKS